MHYTISCDTLYNTNYFSLMPKKNVILEPTTENNFKSLHLDNLDKKYLVNNNKNTEMLDIKYIISINYLFINKYITFIQSRSGIKSTQNSFKSIKFNNS